MFLKLLFLFSLKAASLKSANILAIFPMPYYSHQMVTRVLIKDLAARGHNLTILTTHTFNYDTPNVIQVHLNESQLIYDEMLNQLKYKKTLRFLSAMNELKANYAVMKQHLNNREVQSLMVNEKRQNFDLVITECIAFCPLLAFAEVYNCPIINFVTGDFYVSLLKMMGNQVNPVLHPDRYAFPYVHGKLTFRERLEAFMYDLTMEFITDRILIHLDNSIIREFFPELNVPMKEIISRTAMMFYHTLTTIRPLLPNTIPLRFMHVEQPQPLSDGIIKNFLDDSINGVILMSFGSHVQSENMDSNQINIFVKVFNSLPFKVLWKYKGEPIDTDENVMTAEWFPQSDVLAHPNLKLLITHGGLGSIYESIDREIPMIIIPLAIEQPANAREMVEKGVACIFDLNHINEKSLRNGIFEMMKPKYKDNMRVLKNQMKDQPQGSREIAIWYTEHVIRHKGAKHLQYPGRNVPLYQKYYFDIYFFIVLSALSFHKLTTYMASNLPFTNHFQFVKSTKAQSVTFCCDLILVFVSLLVTYMTVVVILILIN